MDTERLTVVVELVRDGEVVSTLAPFKYPTDVCTAEKYREVLDCSAHAWVGWVATTAANNPEHFRVFDAGPFTLAAVHFGDLTMTADSAADDMAAFQSLGTVAALCGNQVKISLTCHGTARRSATKKRAGPNSAGKKNAVEPVGKVKKVKMEADADPEDIAVVEPQAAARPSRATRNKLPRVAARRPNPATSARLSAPVAPAASPDKAVLKKQLGKETAKAEKLVKMNQKLQANLDKLVASAKRATEAINKKAKGAKAEAAADRKQLNESARAAISAKAAADKAADKARGADKAADKARAIAAAAVKAKAAADEAKAAADEATAAANARCDDLTSLNAALQQERASRQTTFVNVETNSPLRDGGHGPARGRDGDNDRFGDLDRGRGSGQAGGRRHRAAGHDVDRDRGAEVREWEREQDRDPDQDRGRASDEASTRLPRWRPRLTEREHALLHELRRGRIRDVRDLDWEPEREPDRDREQDRGRASDETSTRLPYRHLWSAGREHDMLDEMAQSRRGDEAREERDRGRGWERDRDLEPDRDGGRSCKGGRRAVSIYRRGLHKHEDRDLDWKPEREPDRDRDRDRDRGQGDDRGRARQRNASYSEQPERRRARPRRRSRSRSPTGGYSEHPRRSRSRSWSR